jgi:tetratricopeptide (TPR) repeat protein
MPRPLAALLALAIVAPLPVARAAETAPVGRYAALDAGRRADAANALERDRRGPRGIAALAELGALEGEAPELAPIAAAYAAAIGDRAAHPEVRALARQRLAALERSRGNFQRSAAQVRRLGFVTRWQIVGAFDDEGKRGLETAYPPEERIDLAARYEGKSGEVSWRPLPEEAVVHGFIDLGAAIRPAREVVAYAVSLVEAPRDERVALWLGASGAAQVWVNGAVAISDPGYHPARLDQRGAMVTLRRGTNRVVVKLCHQGGRMGFFLRLADERGDGRTYAAGSPAAPMPEPGAKPAPIAGAVERLDALARAAKGPAAEAEARRVLAVALAERQSADFEERRPAREARRAAELAPRWPEAQLLAASLEEDHARRRSHVEAALAAEPGNPRALAALAREELDQGRPHAALRLLDRAVSAAPRWAAPRVDRVEALDRAGLEVRAVGAAADTADAFPTTPGAVRVAARAAARLSRVDEAVARLRTLLALRLDDAEGRGTLAHLLVERGDVAGAAALFTERLRLDPADGEQRLRLADLLAANGHAEEAEAMYAAALRVAPDDADALERRGRARLAAGRAKDALGDLQAALDRRPQSPELKELVRSLEPARERFEAPYVLDARALAAEAPAPRPDDDAIVLGELKVTRVFPSGLSATFQQLVVQIVNDRGAEAFRRHVISWTPDRQDARVERVRIVKPDGTTVETHDAAERSASEPWYRLYYDTRARTLSFPALAKGDVLEIAWRIEDTAGENLLSDYFGDVTFLDDATRKARVEYVLLVPEARPIYSNAPGGVRHDTRKLPGALVEHRFVARDLGRIQPEPGMPGWSEVARYVHVSTYGDWDQVARFYWRLVKDQLRPTDEVRATAARIVAAALGGGGGEARVTPAVAQGGPRPAIAPPQGGWTLEQKRAIVKGVYDFVVSQTRYVGLEFGIHGYKPYRVDQVLARRFGDCKDKASLVHALLGAAGIDSRLVLLRMRRLGRMPETPASLAVFNHAIAYVPQLDLWLDGTAAHSGSGDLPGEDRGATVLVVNPGAKASFGTVPQARPEDNRVESRFEVTLAADGRAAVRGSSRVRGSQAPQYRRAYLAEHERRAQLERAFGRTFPGAEVTSLDVSDLTRIEEDVAMEFTLDVPRYALADGSGLRFTPFGDAAGYSESYAALSSRRHDLVLGEPAVTSFTYRYVLPKGWAPVEVPDPAAADTPHGAFEVRYRREADALVAEGHVTFKTARVAAAEYPAFRDLAARIDRAFARKVRIAPASAGEGSR